MLLLRVGEYLLELRLEAESLAVFYSIYPVDMFPEDKLKRISPVILSIIPKAFYRLKV